MTTLPSAVELPMSLPKSQAGLVPGKRRAGIGGSPQRFQNVGENRGIAERFLGASLSVHQ
jgi:hypothetical protein